MPAKSTKKKTKGFDPFELVRLRDLELGYDKELLQHEFPKWILKRIKRAKYPFTP